MLDVNTGKGFHYESANFKGTLAERKNASFKVQGIEALQRALADLPDREFQALITRVSRRGLKPVQRQAQRNILTGIQMRSDARQSYASRIKIRTQVYPGKGIIASVVGPDTKRLPHVSGRRGGRYKHTVWANLAHLFERGVRPHSLQVRRGWKLLERFRHGLKRLKGETEGGQHPGIPAQPHIRPAYDARKDEVLRDFEQHMSKDAERTFRRLYRRYGGI